MALKRFAQKQRIVTLGRFGGETKEHTGYSHIGLSGYATRVPAVDR